MSKEDLKERTKNFALRIIKVVNVLPKTIAGKNIANQLMRSGTSTAANYRAACRARSKSEFIAKLCIVEEETDESIFWLEILIDAKIIKEELLKLLLAEANEILAIIIASKKTARKNLKEK